jgi:hypothetical protein
MVDVRVKVLVKVGLGEVEAVLVGVGVLLGLGDVEAVLVGVAVLLGVMVGVSVGDPPASKSMEASA